MNRQGLKQILYKYLPREYIISIQHWSVEGFISEFCPKHQLPCYGDPQNRTVTNFAYWEQKCYHTELSSVFDFDQLAPLVKKDLAAELGEQPYLFFQSFVYTNEAILLVQVDTEAFWELGLVYLDNLAESFNLSIRLVMNADFSKWMLIPSSHLYQIISNFHWDSASTLIRKEDFSLAKLFFCFPLSSSRN